MRTLAIAVIAACALAASGADARQSRPIGVGPNAYSTAEQVRIVNFQAALARARRYDPGYREPPMASRRGVPSVQTIERIRRDAARLGALAQPFQTEPEARNWALSMGYQPFVVTRRAVVYRRGRDYITMDRDGHGIGAWKRGPDPRHLRDPARRTGTFNRDLSVRLRD